MFPISYEEPIFRPPSEGKSVLIQVTIGCSNNLCTYCDMYRSKKYRERNIEDIKTDIDKLHKYFSEMGYMPSRFFLCDGDALGASQNLLVSTLIYLNQKFPNLERVGIYATAQNMLDKTEEQLIELSGLNLNIAYLGLESGSDEVLHLIVKRNTRADMIAGSKKLMNSGFKLSIIAMLGIGGEKLSEKHVSDTASIISEISPDYFSMLTTMSIPGTPFHKMIEKKLFSELTAKKMLLEMREILKNIKPKRDIIFRANHVSNQYPLGGIIPSQTNEMVGILESWIKATPEGIYPPKPSSM